MPRQAPGDPARAGAGITTVLRRRGGGGVCGNRDPRKDPGSVLEWGPQPLDPQGPREFLQLRRGGRRGARGPGLGRGPGRRASEGALHATDRQDLAPTGRGT